MLGLVYPKILKPQVKISRSMFYSDLDRESICTVFGHLGCRHFTTFVIFAAELFVNLNLLGCKRRETTLQGK